MTDLTRRAYHVTTRSRALEILAHGFREDDCVQTWDGHARKEPSPIVRLWLHPKVGNVALPKGFRITRFETADGEPPPPELQWLIDEVNAMNEPDADPREWEPDFPRALVYDPDWSEHTVLEVTLPDDVNLDEYRYEEAMKIRNRRTGKSVTLTPFRWHWAGEWLVPLDVTRRGTVRLLEARVDETHLQEALARWRAIWTKEGVATTVIERRLAELEEELREWEPEAED